MRSDLTCPVEITKVNVRRETEDTKDSGQIVCLIEFFNLSEKAVDSLQMNIICFDAENTRLGGRLVRAAAAGEGRSTFSGTFMPEHVDGAVRVEASVEKVWFKDGVIWRREERNVREYTPNALSEGRELDRLRAVAGADASGYAREDDIVWMCVCGRANRTSDDKCLRCERARDQVLRDYSFSAIDATAGKRERELEQQTRDTLRRSSEDTVKEQNALQRRSKKRRRVMKTVIVLLALAALALAFARWGAPYAASRYAQRLMDEGRLPDAKEIFLFVDAHWPGMYDAGVRADEAEMRIIEGLITAGSDEQLANAQSRAGELGGEAGEALFERAVLARAQLAIDGGDTDKAEELLLSMPHSEEAQQRYRALVYDIAMAAREQVDYPTAIARFESLGDYSDAPAQKEECIYDYGRQLMREERYEEASEQLLLVSGRDDAIELIRRCRYAIAVKKQEGADYIAAAELFETLGVYEEAETRAKLCRYTAGMSAMSAGDLQLAAQQLKAAGDYEDAAERFADAAYTLGSAALEQGDYATAKEWMGQLAHEGEAGKAFDRAAYAYALELKEAGRREEAAVEFALLGDYEDAREHARALEYEIACAEMETAPEDALGRFEGLGDYLDAAELAQGCRYAMAAALYDAGDYEEAMEAFEQLDGYEDARSQTRRSRYALAQAKLAEKQYAEASALFEACGAYLDSEEMTMRAQYELAASLEAAGEYAQAAQTFAALGSYEDAKLRVSKSEDAWLKAAYSGAVMDTELGDYESVISALAPLWQCELPARYASIREMYVTACLERSKELIDQNRPLDALEMLESISGESQAAQKRLEAYVYRIIGRWKDTRGTEYIFRRDGTCSIAGEEAYFSGKDYAVMVGDTPYPTQVRFSVVGIRGGTLTIKNPGDGSTARLSYLGEPTPKAQSEATPGEATLSEATASEATASEATPAEADSKSNFSK